jgi:hypothetical protein
MENLEQNEKTPQIHRNNSGGILSVVLVVLILASLIYGGFLQFKKAELKRDIASTQEIIEAQTSNDLPEDNQEVSLQSKKIFIEEKKSEQIFWTNVYVKFDETIPDNGKIELNNFTGSSEGNISFSAKTTRASIDPYLDTATLIARFKDKPFFTDMFIPAVNSTVNEQGEEFLSYTVRVNYQKDEIDQNLIDLNDKPTSQNTSPDESEVQNLLDLVRTRTQDSNPAENE